MVAGVPVLSSSQNPLAMTVVLLLAGLGASIVFGLALAALVQRRSRSYLLIALAIGTILARTLVAGTYQVGRMDDDLHHLLEHGLDVVMVGLVIAAVYTARRVPTRDTDPD